MAPQGAHFCDLAKGLALTVVIFGLPVRTGNPEMSRFSPLGMQLPLKPLSWCQPFTTTRTGSAWEAPPAGWVWQGSYVSTVGLDATLPPR
jgi:hypothetical protein